MALGINKATIIGHLGSDPEVKYTKAGTAVATFSVATTERWKDKATGEQQESTEWHNCVAFKRTAEICGEWLTKGALVYIEGKLVTSSWQTDSGEKRYKTSIQVRDMKMLGGGRNAGQGSGQSQGHQNGQPQGYQQGGGQQGGNRGYAGPPSGPGSAQQASRQAEFTDDEIPFWR